jgi:1-acyl-sn-glycerol-3-phosphate acyltransferase
MVGGGLSRPLNYLAREDLFRVPVLGSLLRQVNAVPVDRDGGGAAGLRSILNRLLQGGAILLFPEGTRTADGRLRAARSGIGLTVIKSSAPIIPVRLFGTYEAWGRRRAFPRPGRIAVKYGYPLPFTDLRAEARSCSKPRLKAIYQEVGDEIMNAIAHLQPFTERRTFP